MAPRDGLSALPSAAAAQRDSATVAPAALCAWNETQIPTNPASTATAAPPSIARAGVRACWRTASGGADQHGEHQQRAESLNRHCHRRGEQHEQDESHQGRAQARRRCARWVERHRRQRAVEGHERGAAEREQHARGDQVAVGHSERVAEQELLEPLRRIGRERQQRAEAQRPVTATAVPASGPMRASRAAKAISAAATSAPPAAPSSSGAPASAASTSPGSRPCESDSAL